MCIVYLQHTILPEHTRTNTVAETSYLLPLPMPRIGRRSYEPKFLVMARQAIGRFDDPAKRNDRTRGAANTDDNQNPAKILFLRFRGKTEILVFIYQPRTIMATTTDQPWSTGSCSPDAIRILIRSWPTKTHTVRRLWWCRLFEQAKQARSICVTLTYNKSNLNPWNQTLTKPTDQPFPTMEYDEFQNIDIACDNLTGAVMTNSPGRTHGTKSANICWKTIARYQLVAVSNPFPTL